MRHSFASSDLNLKISQTFYLIISMECRNNGVTLKCQLILIFRKRKNEWIN